MASLWQKNKENLPEIHSILQFVTAQIYEKVSIKVEISNCPDVDIQKAVESDSLVFKDKKVFFKDFEILREYLVYHIIEIMESQWSKVEKIIEIHADFSRFCRRFNLGKLENEVLIKLANERSKDLSNCLIKVSEFRDFENLKYSFHKLYTSFWEVLPNINVNSEKIISILDAIDSDFDKGGVAIFRSIEEICERDTHIANNLYDQLIARKNYSFACLIFNILQGKSKVNLSEAHQKALNLLNPDDPILCRSGISILGAFNYEDDDSGELLKLTLKKLEYFRSNFNPETDTALVLAYKDLIKQTDEVQNIFKELASSSNPTILKHTLDSLFDLVKSEYSKEWYKTTLKKLVNSLNLDDFSLDDLRILDYCTEEYITTNPDFSIEIIELIANKWDFNIYNNENLIDIFKETFRKLSNSKIEFLKYSFTQWVASNSQKYHLLAYHIYCYFISIPVKVDNRL